MEEVGGLTENSPCRFRKEQRETVQHLLAGCKMLLSSEYLVTHNRTRMVMAVTWAKEQNLLDREMVSRKVEKGSCFRELSSKASMRL